MCVHLCVYVLHMCMYVYVHICVYVCVCVCVHMCMRVCGVVWSCLGEGRLVVHVNHSWPSALAVTSTVLLQNVI